MVLLWLLAAVAGFIAAIVALLLVVLAVPLGVRATRSAESDRVVVTARWLFGVVRIPLTGRASGAPDAPAPGRTKRGTRRGTGRRPPRSAATHNRSRRPALEEIPIMVRAVLILLKRVLRRFTVAADGDVSIGLSDPADTGIVWGISAPLLRRLGEGVGLRVQPSFAGAHFSFTGRATVEVVPVTVALPVLRFLLSHDGRTVVRVLRGRA